MKKSKILIPTLAIGSLIPAITTSVSCNKNNTDAESIINAIIAPTKIKESVSIEDMVTELTKLSTTNRQKEVLYDIFGFTNNKDTEGTFSFEKPLTTMWSENTVSFKTNISKCQLSIDENKNVKASFLGYISFVFNKEVKGKMLGNDVTFKANDYIMITYDFLNAPITIDTGACSLSYAPKLAGTVMGFYKVKYNGQADEAMINLGNPNTETYKPTNSHWWV